MARTPSCVDERGGGGRADAVEQAQRPGPGQLVPRVVEQAQQRQQVLHVGRLEEPQPAVLHVGDVAAGELQLEEVGVPGGAEQHRLVAQLDALVAVGEHAVAHRRGLGRPRRRRCAAPGGGRPARVATSTLPDEWPGAARGHDGVGDGHDRRRRAVVGLSVTTVARRVARGEVEDVARRGGPEAVDGLGVVAHHGEAGPVRAQRVEDVGLQRVGVLVLVDEDVVEGAATAAASLGRASQRPPEQQQVVEVEHVLGSLALACTATRQRADGVDVVARTTAKRWPTVVGQALLGVDDPAGDGRRASRPWGTGGRRGGRSAAKPSFGAHQADQLDGVAGVEHGERRDRGPTSRPWRRRNRLPTAWNVPPHTRAAGRAETPDHLRRRPPAEGQQADRARAPRRVRSSRPTRATKVRVLPEPAPATTTSGPVAVGHRPLLSLGHPRTIIIEHVFDLSPSPSHSGIE